MSDVVFRAARREDVPAIVDMLFDDDLGAQREDNSRPLSPVYYSAFDAFEVDGNARLIVAEQAGVVVGCMQLYFLPGLSHQGTWRGEIESVRVARAARGTGLGRQLIEHAIETFRARGCGMVQLTSTSSRVDAIRFYESLGFVASHTGLKLSLK